MANVDVIMPQMGESITEGTLVKWLKKEGDAVSRDEPLFEISTEKVDVEIPAPAGGVLAAIKVKEGETVPVNTIVAVIAREGAGEAAAPAKPAAGGDKAAGGAGEEKGASGARPAGGEGAGGGAKPAPAGAAARPTRPAPAHFDVPDAEAPAAAAAETPRAKGAEVVQMDSARRRGGGEVAEAAEAEADDAAGSRDERRRLRSSPLVRKMAREHGVDLAAVAGSGVSGRITKDDLLDHIEQGSARPAAVGAPARGTSGEGAAAGRSSAPPAPAATPAATSGAALAGKVMPLTTIRKKIAEHMLASRRTSAHVTTVFEMDMSRVHALRDKQKRAFEEQHGVKLTYTALIARAVVRTLQDWPSLNASIDGDNVVYHPHVNLGIAVALDWGLLVPVIRNAEERNVLGLQRAITDLAERARSRKLKPEEMQGGTFTLTNPGTYGGLFGTPIINQPQVAILGLGVVEKRAVVIDDAIAIRPMCNFALSFDHRLIDGAVADQFMAQLKTALKEMADVG